MIFVELCHRPYVRRQDAEAPSGGDGSHSGQSRGRVCPHFITEMQRLPPSDDDYSNSNKVRIIALYIQYREGVPDEDRRRLYQHARLTMAEQDAVNALVHLGVRISRV